MSAKWEVPIILEQAQFDVDTVGDKATFTIAHKCVVKRVQCVITSTDAGGGTIAFDKRPTAGSDTARGNADVGALTVPASNQQGKVIYRENATLVTLVPGDQVVCEVLTDPGAGATMIPQLVVYYVPETEENMADMLAA